MANPLKLLKLKPKGFQFILDTPVNAPPAKVWKALMNIDGWFYFKGSPMHENVRQTIDPKIGGVFKFEKRDGSVSMLNGFVSHIEPNKLLRINGPMGASHLPICTVMIFELVPKNGGKTTLLRFCQRTFGNMTADLEKNFKGGWKQLMPQLKALAEKKR